MSKNKTKQQPQLVNSQDKPVEVITSFDQIEQSRFEMFDFKQTLSDLIKTMRHFFQDHLDSVLQKSIPVLELHAKMHDVRQKSKRVEQHVEAMAKGLIQMLNNETMNAQKQIQNQDELAKSLKEIEITYQKNKQRLEKDLNKMESKMYEIRDTRERIQFKHIKSCDIMEREFHKIMPHTLTATQLKNELKATGQLSSLEQIRNDLDNADDVFLLGFGATTPQNNTQQITWDKSSTEEDDLDKHPNSQENTRAITESKELSEMQAAREKLMSKIGSSTDGNDVLVQQLLDMEIKKKKKQIKQNSEQMSQQSQNSSRAVQSHRQELKNQSLRTSLANRPQYDDYKAHSLKTSKEIQSNLRERSESSQDGATTSLSRADRFTDASNNPYQVPLYNNNNNNSTYKQQQDVSMLGFEDQSPLSSCTKPRISHISNISSVANTTQPRFQLIVSPSSSYNQSKQVKEPKTDQQIRPKVRVIKHMVRQEPISPRLSNRAGDRSSIQLQMNTIRDNKSCGVSGQKRNLKINIGARKKMSIKQLITNNNNSSSVSNHNNNNNNNSQVNSSRNN